jgi:hypothetical protein
MSAALPPTRTITVRLDPHVLETAEQLASATQRTPSGLVRDWVTERIALLRSEVGGEARPAPANSSHQRDPREELRQTYRPDDIVVLLVGESPPAGDSFFYEADSHLFEATREAFERALGPMPEGTAFLERFESMGFWLYDVSGEPVNRLRGRPRHTAVSAGVAALGQLIADAEPDFVVAVKASLEGVVRQATTIAGFPGNRVRILPFPLYQWREEYLNELSRFLGRKDEVASSRIPAISTGVKPEDAPITLHKAMERVLRSAPNRRMTARQLANEVGRLGLYQRRDGAHAPYSQILARARKYPRLFDVDRDGVGLRG